MIVKKSQDVEQPEGGSYPGTCCRVIDIGTQRGSFKGEDTVRRQVILGFELDEKNSEGKPFLVTAFFTASLHEKAKLRAVLESWRGAPFTDVELEGFDLKKLMGHGALIVLTKGENKKAKITGISKLPKGTRGPKLTYPEIYFSLDEFDQKVFDGLSDGLKKIIEKAPEYRAIKGGGGDDQRHPVDDAGFPDDDDIPFGHQFAGASGLGYRLPGLAGRTVL